MSTLDFLNNIQNKLHATVLNQLFTNIFDRSSNFVLVVLSTKPLSNRRSIPLDGDVQKNIKAHKHKLLVFKCIYAYVCVRGGRSFIFCIFALQSPSI